MHLKYPLQGKQSLISSKVTSTTIMSLFRPFQMKFSKVIVYLYILVCPDVNIVFKFDRILISFALTALTRNVSLHETEHNYIKFTKTLCCMFSHHWPKNKCLKVLQFTHSNSSHFKMLWLLVGLFSYIVKACKVLCS